MPPDVDRARLHLRTVALFLLGASLFALAYGQAPLYYSNQNQYCLHGLANADEGFLRDDWLAQTRDPTPLFTALVAFTVRWLHPWAFYVYYALLQGAYAAALLALFVAIVGTAAAERRWPLFLALFVLVHSAAARSASYRWLGNDYPWFLQSGVAGQYAVGAMFQPSSFGVLVVITVACFVQGRIYAAAVCTALAAIIHSTYLLPGALLTLGFLAALIAEGRLWQAVRVGALTLALVAPSVVYLLAEFGPSSRETFAQAQAILVDFRIPHHCLPELWLDAIAGLQIAAMLVATLLTWRTRLFFVLCVPFGLAAVLTAAQAATQSHTLALLFPWRVSVVLMPIATTVLLSKVASAPWSALDGSATRLASLGLVVVLAALGLWICLGRHGFRVNDEEIPLLNYIRDNKTAGDVYFLPVKTDAAPRARGSLSSDFMPLPEKKQGEKVIRVDLQRFRLYTAAPIFVDFKSIPYKDVEVLEWRQRLRIAQQVQTDLREGRTAEAVAELRAHGVTHLIVPATQTPDSPDLDKVYEDEHYRLYRLRAAPRRD
jgi:hypothetical protein